jgi:hypothetical protein
MPRFNFPLLTRRWLWGMAALCFWAQTVRAQYDPDWARNFRIGMLVGFNINADFRMNGTFNISGSNPGATGVPGVEHIYDDGYVRVDDFNNAGGYTTYWGYQNASQVSGQNLLFHSSSSFSTSAGNVQESEPAFVGFEMAYGGNLWYWKDLRFGWELGFGLMPISITDDRPLSANVVQSTFSFDTGGIALPGAPYNGGPSGFGQPSILDIATLVGTTNLGNQSITGSRKLDVILYTFRLGPSVFWDLNDRIGLAASFGPAVGLVSGAYEFNETITTSTGPVRNRGSFGATDFVYGGYVSGTITYHVTENGDFYIGAQFMPLGSATFSEGGRSAKLNLSGSVFVSAGVNWPF